MKRNASRREFLRQTIVGSGAALTTFDAPVWPRLQQKAEDELLRAGKKLGIVEFTQEAKVPMETALGEELDGRLFTDLSKLTPESPLTATEAFYVRTSASHLLKRQNPWVMEVDGQPERSLKIGEAELRRLATPMGVHLMECSGNSRGVHFGMMSVAEWDGVPVGEILERAGLTSGDTRVEISGFDTYENPSQSSIPGASWNFSLRELQSARAFLACRMNGQLLTANHGAPVRLVVPRWYGCTCIKWVNQIRVVQDDAEATSQMREYAGRTMQNGLPRLAREFQPPVIEQAAMPIRVEKWSVEGKMVYRVAGILWGGSRRVEHLEISFNPDENYVPIGDLQHSANDPWSFWTHEWTPKRPGSYSIRLRVSDPGIPARRLNAGHYLRTVNITEV